MHTHVISVAFNNNVICLVYTGLPSGKALLPTVS